MRFTDRMIKALKAKSDRYEVWEDGRTGLGLRVTPRGVKTFVFMYRFEGKARRLTLGRYSLSPATGITLAAARTAKGEAEQKLEQGIDPAIEIVEERHVERHAETVKQLVDLYLEKWAKPRKRSAGEDERILNKDVVPVWGRRKAGSIKKGDVVALIDDILNRGAPIQANRTLACIRKLFNFAMSRDVAGISVNPCLGISMPAAENVRSRRLNDQEIVEFWYGLDNEDVEMSKALREALRLQLATVQRKAEVAGADWSEFNIEDRVWTIPASRAKNSVEHIVPLNDVALEVLATIKKRTKGKGWLFPSPRGKVPVSAAAINHALRRNLKHIGVDGVTPHDLRRTGSSVMGRLKVPRFIISRVLNHVDRSVTGRYDVWEYLEERRDALDRWGLHLKALLDGEGAQVIPIRENEEQASA
jgi:integrase